MEQTLENILNCPICHSQTSNLFLETKDFFLTQESFSIQQCKECGFLFTSPRPTKVAVGPYYKSNDYISHSNKKKGVFAFIYQRIRNLNLTIKYSLIRKYTVPGKALDIGSGTGHFLHYLQKKNWEVQGIEPDEETAARARKMFGLLIENENAILKLKNEKFDLISMWHVLEHVHDLDERLHQIHRLLKPNSLFLLALPNPESYDSNYYVKYWAGYDVPRHLYHFRKKDVFALATKHNFRIEKIHPMYFDAFYVSLLSEKYQGAKLRKIRAIWIGMLSNLKNSTKNPNTSSLIYVLRKN